MYRLTIAASPISKQEAAEAKRKAELKAVQGGGSGVRKSGGIGLGGAVSGEPGLKSPPPSPPPSPSSSPDGFAQRQLQTDDATAAEVRLSVGRLTQHSSALPLPPPSPPPGPPGDSSTGGIALQPKGSDGGDPDENLEAVGIWKQLSVGARLTSGREGSQQKPKTPPSRWRNPACAAVAKLAPSTDRTRRCAAVLRASASASTLSAHSPASSMSDAAANLRLTRACRPHT